jgi:hypothetical protein
MSNLAENFLRASDPSGFEEKARVGLLRPNTGELCMAANTVYTLGVRFTDLVPVLSNRQAAVQITITTAVANTWSA